MLAGLHAAKLNSDAAIIIDVDLQDPPSLIPEMLKYYDKDINTYAKHKTRKGEPFLKQYVQRHFIKIYAILIGDKT